MGSIEPAKNECEVIYETLHRHREVTGSNPVEVQTFSGFYIQLLKLRSQLRGS